MGVEVGLKLRFRNASFAVPSLEVDLVLVDGLGMDIPTISS